MYSIFGKGIIIISEFQTLFYVERQGNTDLCLLSVTTYYHLKHDPFPEISLEKILLTKHTIPLQLTSKNWVVQGIALNFTWINLSSLSHTYIYSGLMMMVFYVHPHGAIWLPPQCVRDYHFLPQKCPEIEESQFILCSGVLRNKNGSVSHEHAYVRTCTCTVHITDSQNSIIAITYILIAYMLDLLDIDQGKKVFQSSLSNLGWYNVYLKQEWFCKSRTHNILHKYIDFSKIRTITTVLNFSWYIQHTYNPCVQTICSFGYKY